MRCAAYYPWIDLKSGVERTVLEVLRRSRHDWTWYTNHFDRSGTFPELADLPIAQINPRMPRRTGMIGNLATAVDLTRSKIPADHHDATLICINGLTDLALARAPHPLVGHCLTPVKALYDRPARAAIRADKPAKFIAASLVGPPFMAVDRRLWRRMDRVVANSEETRSRIHSAGLRDRSAVDVARPGVDTDFYSPAYGPRRRQLLVAGRISWHKNIQLAIEASRILIDRRVEHDLVIAGFVDAKDEAYVAELRALAGGLPIQFRPDPSDADLRDLYRESEALLFTPHNEDFGLVPLEAMACGTPVISVDAGGPRETIVDGSTGWLVAPEPAAFAERIVALLTDPDRARFHTTARDRAVEFGWDRFVAQIDDVMQAVVSAKGRAG